MSRSRPMKWNSFYRFWTILNCISGTIWCLALIAVLAIYSLGVDFFSTMIVLLDSNVLKAAVDLIIQLLVNGLVFLVLSYAAVPALNKYNNRSGLIRIYIQTLAAAVSHLLKVLFLRDFFDVLTRSMSTINLNNMDLGIYAVLIILFFVRTVIFLIGSVYYYKRKRR